jgi:hypothetical protein
MGLDDLKTTQVYLHTTEKHLLEAMERLKTRGVCEAWSRKARKYWVRHLLRNQQVVGSIPTAGSTKFRTLGRFPRDSPPGASPYLSENGRL